MYFAFLFVLRSVIKAGDILVSYNFNTGNVSDDTAVRQLIANLVGKTKGSAHPMSSSAMPYSAVVDGKSNADRNVKAIEECKHGFDESEMFQVYIHILFCYGLVPTTFVQPFRYPKSLNRLRRPIGTFLKRSTNCGRSSKQSTSKISH